TGSGGGGDCGELAAYLRRVLVGVEAGEQVQGAVADDREPGDARLGQDGLVDGAGVPDLDPQPGLGDRVDLDDVVRAAEADDDAARLLGGHRVAQPHGGPARWLAADLA